MIGHGGDVLREPVAADVFLADDEQVDAEALGFLADVAGVLHVGGVDRAVHPEAVEDFLGLGDQRLGLRHRHKLGQIGLAQLVDVVQLAVGEKARPADAAQDVAGLAFEAFAVVVDAAVALEGGFALLDHQHPQIGILAEVVGGKKPGRPGADHDDVVILL